jgi:hypothetical protein
MKKLLTGLFLASFAASLAAQQGMPDKPRIQKIPARGVAAAAELLAAGLARTNGVTYQGGPVLIQARLVFLFWGPTFANAASPDHTYATSLQSFRNQYGTSAEYNILTQYYQIVDGVKQYIELTNLAAGTADLFDTSTPPASVTDADVQAEVAKYLKTHTFDSETIYSVVIPSTSYSSDEGEDSCGGPDLAYCAYHSSYSSGSSNVIYTIQPYPSCSGCQVSGWTAAQNQDHFLVHETGDAVTDPLGTSWWDTRTGEEVEEMCAWSPPPFLSGGYGYQYQWSNATSSCVQLR